jgi:hypothetical protein
MSMIYDLDNEYGGKILGDTDTPGPSLEVNSNASQTAFQVASTASANPIQVDSFAGFSARFRSIATAGTALTVGRTVVGSPTVGLLTFNHTSMASAAIITFNGGYVSTTSILGIGATGAGLGFDYVIPVSLGGVIRGIPVTSLASLVGAGAF